MLKKLLAFVLSGLLGGSQCMKGAAFASEHRQHIHSSILALQNAPIQGVQDIEFR